MYLFNLLMPRGTVSSDASSMQFCSGFDVLNADESSLSIDAAPPPDAVDSTDVSKADASASLCLLERGNAQRQVSQQTADEQLISALKLRARTAQASGNVSHLIVQMPSGVEASVEIAPSADLEAAMQQALHLAGGDGTLIAHSRTRPLRTNIVVAGGGSITCSDGNDPRISKVFAGRSLSSIRSIDELDELVVRTFGTRMWTAYSEYIRRLPSSPPVYAWPILKALLEADELPFVTIDTEQYLQNAGFSDARIREMYSMEKRERNRAAGRFLGDAGVSWKSIQSRAGLDAAIADIPERWQGVTVMHFLKALDGELPDEIVNGVVVPLLESGESYVAGEAEDALRRLGWTDSQIARAFSMEVRQANQADVARRNARFDFEQQTGRPWDSISMHTDLVAAIEQQPPENVYLEKAARHFFDGLPADLSDSIINDILIPLLESGDVDLAQGAEAALGRKGFSPEQIAKLYSPAVREANRILEKRRRARKEFESHTGVSVDTIQTLSELHAACRRDQFGPMWAKYVSFLDALPEDAPQKLIQDIVMPLVSSKEYFISQSAQRILDDRARRGLPAGPRIVRVK